MPQRPSALSSIQSQAPAGAPVRNSGELVAYCVTVLLMVTDAGVLLYDLGRAITAIV